MERVNPQDRLRRFGLILLLASLGTGCAQQPPVASPSGDVYFGPRFQEGRVASYRFVSDSATTQTRAEQVRVRTSRSEAILRLTVSRVFEDGSADLTMTYDHLMASGNFLGEAYHFDSKHNLPDPHTDAAITGGLRLLAESIVTCHADASGGIDPASVDGTAVACDAIRRIVSLEDLVTQYNSEGLADLFEDLWHVGREARVRDVAKPWRERGARQVDGIGYWRYAHEFSAVGQDSRHVVISMKVSMELDSSDAGSAFKLNKGDFHYVWDRQRCELVQRTGVLDYDWDYWVEGEFPNPHVHEHQEMATTLQRIDE